MFEDLNQEKKSVEDIFAETEIKTFNPQSLPSKPGIPPPPVYAPAPLAAPVAVVDEEPKKMGGVVKWLVVLVLAGVVGGGMYAAYQFWYLPSTTESVAPLGNDNTNIENNATENSDSQNEPVAPTGEVDGDGDRLSDSQEYNLETDAANSDSDYDGLFDGEEVNIYHTNPLSPDTDDDGYFDGIEVQSGYNPNGAGRLLELPNGEVNLQEIDKIIKEIDKQPS